jgi:hypothetical protein
MKAYLSGAVFAQVFLNNCRYLNGHPDEKKYAVLIGYFIANSTGYIFITPFSAKTR